MRNLTEHDYQNAAKLLGLEIPLIKAVARVEAPRGGFVPDGRPIILFEGHVFYKQLQYLGINPKPLQREFPTIIYPNWTKKYYLGYNNKRVLTADIDDEFERLAVAQTINNEAAVKSCSWGKFQIMGFNFNKCGYDNVFDFVFDMQKTEREHLFAFCRFIEGRGLTKYLRGKEWAKFSYYYNGKDYYKNSYDIKLSEEYYKLARLYR